jgi:signal peptidase II
LILAVAVPTVLATGAARLWAERGLDYGEPVPLVGDLFRFTLGENAGVAFGLLRGSPLVPWLAALALVAFALYLARPLSGSRAGGAALGLILGGGLANLIDRVGDGSVTDYLDVGLGNWRWPTSNLPDVAITAGVVLALWLIARDPSGEPKSLMDYEEDAH